MAQRGVWRFFSCVYRARERVFLLDIVSQATRLSLRRKKDGEHLFTMGFVWRSKSLHVSALLLDCGDLIVRQLRGSDSRVSFSTKPKTT